MHRLLLQKKLKDVNRFGHGSNGDTSVVAPVVARSGNGISQVGDNNRDDHDSGGYGSSGGESFSCSSDDDDDDDGSEDSDGTFESLNDGNEVGGSDYDDSCGGEEDDGDGIASLRNGPSFSPSLPSMLSSHTSSLSCCPWQSSLWNWCVVLEMKALNTIHATASPSSRRHSSRHSLSRQFCPLRQMLTKQMVVTSSPSPSPPPPPPATLIPALDVDIDEIDQNVDISTTTIPTPPEKEEEEESEFSEKCPKTNPLPNTEDDDKGEEGGAEAKNESSSDHHPKTRTRTLSEFRTSDLFALEDLLGGNVERSGSSGRGVCLLAVRMDHRASSSSTLSGSKFHAPVVSR